MKTSLSQPLHIGQRQNLLVALFLSIVLALGWAGIAQAADQAKEAKGLTTLKTATPEEGFALAVKLAQKGVATVQKDPEVRKELRPNYDHDPDSLIAVSHVIATHFQTISAANNYWAQ